MSVDDSDGQMIFGDLGGRKLPDIYLTGEEKPRKNLTQETSDRGSNPGPLRDRRACYHPLHSSGLTLLPQQQNNMGGSPGDVSKEPVTYEKRKKGSDYEL